MQRFLYSLLALLLIIAVETLLIGLVTGSLHLRIRSPILQEFGYFISLFRHEPIDSLKFFFVLKPVIMIESRQLSVETNAWALHFYLITIVIHAWLAYRLAGHFLTAYGKARWQSVPVAGYSLLLIASLYLFLASCCTGGESNWIIHTALLTQVFDPLKASDMVVSFYEMIEGWMTVIQWTLAAAGAYIVYWHGRKQEAE